MYLINDQSAHMSIRAKNQNNNTNNSLRGPYRSLSLSYPGDVGLGKT